MATAATIDRPRASESSAECATRGSDLISDELVEGLFVTATAPAGWYEIDENTRRWFDGRRWTDHYAPILRLVPDLDPEPENSGVNHGFHAIMVIMTIGIWSPIWLAVGVCNLVRSRGVAPRG